MGRDAGMFPISPVFEGKLCFRVRGEESENRFRRRVGTRQMSCLSGERVKGHRKLSWYIFTKCHAAV